MILRVEYRPLCDGGHRVFVVPSYFVLFRCSSRDALGAILDLYAARLSQSAMGEKGGFLSHTESIRTLTHNYKRQGNKLFEQFLDVTYTHKPFSINAIPFRWMLKDKSSNESEMAQRFDLLYDPQKEESLCASLGFRPGWVQHRDNQKILLDTFFGCLAPEDSLVFFYAKHTPLSEVNQKVIIGVAYIKHIGSIIDFNYPPDYKGHRAYVWDRLVYHSLINAGDGCILPYHDLVAHQEQNPEDSPLCRDCVCFAPDHEQFSHGSELVENDTAIDALFSLQASFKKAEGLLKQDYSKQLEWLDHAIARVWNMRGAFPSMGNVLSAKGFDGGNSIAWRIEQNIIDTYGNIYAADPWRLFDQCVRDVTNIPGLTLNRTIRTQWNAALTDADKMKMRLLSRIQMNDKQAQEAIKADFALDNPYELYEILRRNFISIPFMALDKACFPAKVVADAFPITEVPVFDNQLDIRRVRAGVIFALEYFADKGDTLTSSDVLLKFLDEAAFSTPMPLTCALLDNYSRDDFFAVHVIQKVNELESGERTVFYKLVILEKVLRKITPLLNPAVLEKRQLKYRESMGDYRELLDSQIPEPYNPADETDTRSRKEKVDAMGVLVRYRFSVLVGPAGSGKTTLLKALCAIPSIKEKGVVMLAPTGKARVNMSNDAQTIAQYLYRYKRYDINSGKYFMNPNEPRETCGTLIVDEASMLTEEQLAAVLDAVSAERIILIGDYKQLPPIGAGRPFFDIVEKFKPENGALTGTAYAEITNVSRQRSSKGVERLDVKLSKFFGNPQKEDFEEIRELIDIIEAGKSSHIELIRWDNGEDLHKKLIEVMSR